MEFGICVPHYGKPVEIERISEWQSAEELGFASVWVTDHVFVPRTMEIIYRDNMLEPLALLSPGRSGVTRAPGYERDYSALPQSHHCGQDAGDH